MYDSRERITMKLFIIFLLTSISLMAQVPMSVVTDNGETESATLELNGLHVVGIDVSADFNADSIYVITSSSKAGTYERVYRAEDGTPVGFPAVAGRFYRLLPTDYYLFEKYIKLEHNSAADADQTHTVYLGNYN